MKKFFLMAIAILGIGVASAQTNYSDEVTVTLDNAKTITLSKVGIKSMAMSLELLLSRDDLVTLTHHVADIEGQKVKTYRYKGITLNFDLNRGVILIKGYGHTVEIKNMHQLIQYFNL